MLATRVRSPSKAEGLRFYFGGKAMSKNLKYFMREASDVEKVVTVPAPESFKDENGKVTTAFSIGRAKNFFAASSCRRSRTQKRP